MRLGLALTHHERFDLLRESVAQVQDDPRIAEIVIVDDASRDGSWERIVEAYGGVPKYRLFQNARNIDCYANKAEALRRSIQEWVILFDSDNVMTSAYLDALEAETLQPGTAYLPVFAEPEFDYRAFSGRTIDYGNVGKFMQMPMFSTALNTANYVVERSTYLAAWDPEAKPGTADSIFMNHRWLRAGLSLKFVPGMHYFHRIHDGSHFITKNNPQDEALKRRIEADLRRM